MKILVISDSHGNYPLALRAVQQVEPVQAIIHLGDGLDDAELISYTTECEVIRLAGNCDAAARAPRELVREFGGRRVLLTHGDRYGIKSGTGRLEKRAQEVGAEAVLFGHTHRAEILTTDDLLMINPGTLMKGSSLLSFALMEIADSGITCSIVEIA